MLFDTKIVLDGDDNITLKDIYILLKSIDERLSVIEQMLQVKN